MPMVKCTSCGAEFDPNWFSDGGTKFCGECRIKSAQAKPAAPERTFGKKTAPAVDPEKRGSSTGFSYAADVSAFEGPADAKPCEWEESWLKNPPLAYLMTLNGVILSPVSYFGRINPFSNWISLIVLAYLHCLIFLLALPTSRDGVGWLLKIAILPATPKEFLPDVRAFYQTVLHAKTVFNTPDLFINAVVTLAVLVLVAFVFHICFKVIGGTFKEPDTTISVMGLSTLAMPFCFIPNVGWMIYFLYFLIHNIGGQAEAHNVSGLMFGFGVFLVLMIAVFGGTCFSM